MKKQILINLILLGSVLTINAQWNGTSPSPLWTNSKVGIGTDNPLSKLEVKNGDLLIRNLNNIDYSSALMIAHSINVENHTTFGTSLRTITQSGGSNTYGLQFFTQQSYATGQTEKMRINGNGNIDFPYHKDFPSIRGTIRHNGNGSGFSLYAQGANNSTLGSGGFTFFTTEINSQNSSNDAPYTKSFEIAYDGTASVYFDNSFPNIRGGFKHTGNESGFSFYSQGTNNSTWGSGGFTFFTTNTNSSNSSTDAPYLKSMVIAPNGNVGIGATSPNAKLHIPNGDAIIGGNASITPASINSTLMVISKDNNSATYPFYVGLSTGSDLFWVKGNGDGFFRERLGIGTLTPAYELDVCGTIRAKEVKVELQGTCIPDFVFKDDYKLMDLNTLEEFVKTNQHLPEIVPEKEMVENGVNMKELQMKLLQKIEELTLYTIEQNKKIMELEKQNAKIQALEEKIEKLASTSR